MSQHECLIGPHPLLPAAVKVRELGAAWPRTSAPRVERKCAWHARLQEAGLRTTVSVGVGAFREGPSADMVAPVAELMKRVKASGKNGVVARAIDFVPAAVAGTAVG